MPGCNAERAARKATIDRTVKGIASSTLNIDLRHVSRSIDEVDSLVPSISTHRFRRKCRGKLPKCDDASV